jgi:cytochrome c oxidase cbb3-type subunit III
MKKVLIGSYLLIMVIVLVLIITGDSLKDKRDSKPVLAGEKVYKRQCMVCHGATGKGEGSKHGTAIHNQNFLNSVSTKDLENYIQYGRPGTQMPSYRASIHKKDLNNLVAFIKSWKTEQIHFFVPKVISGNKDNGKKLYQLYCAVCHGGRAPGKKQIGPVLSNQKYLRYTSDRQIWISTAYGREATTMGPSLKGLDGVRQLKPDDISDIVTYIRSLYKKQ